MWFLSKINFNIWQLTQSEMADLPIRQNRKYYHHSRRHFSSFPPLWSKNSFAYGLPFVMKGGRREVRGKCMHDYTTTFDSPLSQSLISSSALLSLSWPSHSMSPVVQAGSSVWVRAQKVYRHLCAVATDGCAQRICIFIFIINTVWV